MSFLNSFGMSRKPGFYSINFWYSEMFMPVSCSYAASVMGGIVGGQYWVTLGAVPPYCLSRCEGNTSRASSSGSPLSAKI